MNIDIKSMAAGMVAQTKQLRETFDREYYVTYDEPTDIGDLRRSHKRVFCDHVEVESGLVRFVDESGNDRWTIEASRVIEYEEAEVI